MDYGVVLFTKLLLTCIILILAIALPDWACGQIFYECFPNGSVKRTTTAFVCASLVCLLITLIIDIIGLIRKGPTNNRICALVRTVFLATGACLLIVGLIVYVTAFDQFWSYILSVCAAVMATELALYSIFECFGVK
ncbi:uncharacterized protein DEA37_0010445 [Paragonimus westermani]|uniref:MARVEL domain-containing protein n=1 Tax=Paragonimus westermani TaxID=34504 RepID=A0A5J4NIY3_9TREM|nr:uncharacterized protein DEA37_0010445 [Paragonimus westermani]